MDLTFSSLSVRLLEHGIWAAPGGASGVLEAPFWGPCGGRESSGSSFLGVPILDHILGSIGKGAGTPLTSKTGWLGSDGQLETKANPFLGSSGAS